MTLSFSPPPWHSKKRDDFLTFLLPPLYPPLRACSERGLFVKDERGHTWKFYYKGAKYSPFKVGLLDFTNPGAKSFYADLLDQSTKLGFRGFMYDYGEYVDPLMR